jgi:hypothetical protein
MREHREAQRKAWRDPALRKYLATRMRLTAIISAANTATNGSGIEIIILRTLGTFPKDVAKVQKYLKMAGYSSDAECVEALKRLFPKTKETAFLYEGLLVEDEKDIIEEARKRQKKQEELTKYKRPQPETRKRSLEKR